MTGPEPPSALTILTIGHSARTLDELIVMLSSHGIRLLVDVRASPRSRRNPQFNCENLEVRMPAAGIAYAHRKGLGGLRAPRKDSSNTGWRNDGFRGYADYMQTADFEAELSSLIKAAGAQATAIMCAEARASECHRSLIADALCVRGIQVEHIVDAGSREVHRIHRLARIDGCHITYPPQQGILL